MKNFKNSSSESASPSNKRAHLSSSKNKKSSPQKNNPYPQSSIVGRNGVGAASHRLSTSTSPQTLGFESPSQSRRSFPASTDDGHGVTSSTTGTKSTAPTVSTNGDTIHSEAERSKAGTSGTAAYGASMEAGSTFSSPAPSVRSLTTTLTTVQSAAPSALINGGGHQAVQPASNQQQSSQHNSVQFSHQFPTSPTPPSAIPSHLAPHNTHPVTYNAATANNVLSDDASVLTLASSSKRRRRNSLDTNASVRALAPSSVFGGSRESLPLSILSGTADNVTSSGQQGLMHRPSVGHGIASAERASVYSSSGIAPPWTSDRNSYYAGKSGAPGDGGSIRSNLPGHGRNDSTTGSIGGVASPSSPLTTNSPVVANVPGRMSRRNSGWGEIPCEGESENGSETYEDGKSTHNGSMLQHNGGIV